MIIFGFITYFTNTLFITFFITITYFSRNIIRYSFSINYGVSRCYQKYSYYLCTWIEPGFMFLAFFLNDSLVYFDNWIIWLCYLSESDYSYSTFCSFIKLGFLIFILYALNYFVYPFPPFPLIPTVLFDWCYCFSYFL